jgi:hypothetical protein
MEESFETASRKMVGVFADDGSGIQTRPLPAAWNRHILAVAEMRGEADRELLADGVIATPRDVADCSPCFGPPHPLIGLRSLSPSPRANLYPPDAYHKVAHSTVLRRPEHEVPVARHPLAREDVAGVSGQAFGADSFTRIDLF